MASEREKDKTVLIVSLVLCGAIGIWAIAAPEHMVATCLGLINYSLDSLGWLFLFLCSGFLILSGYLAFGPYGKIKLGRDDEEPEFSTVSWLAMLFAGGMGAGLLFWGVAEPMYHFKGPPGMEGGTAEAARMALVFTNLHWGLHAWAIYGICALVIAYFMYRKGLPGQISTPILAAFGQGQGTRTVGVTADVVGVLAVIFGLAGSLTMGILQVRAGLGVVWDAPQSHVMSMTILAVLTVVFLISASTGVDKGIKILSNINMGIASFILAVVLFLGPTGFIFQSFMNAIGDYFSTLLTTSFRLFSYEGNTGWTNGWTLTYLIWWIAWGPFVGIFIARISRGRTIREFMLGVVLVPTLFSMFWFSAFGGSGIYIEMFGGGGLAELVFEDITKALFVFLGYFPMTGLLTVLALALIFIFLVTSADSGTFVVSMMTTNGNLNPDTKTKITWGVIMAAITSAVLLTESITVAKAMAITGAIPFTFIMVLQLVAFLRTLREDVAGEAKRAPRVAVGARR